MSCRSFSISSFVIINVKNAFSFQDAGKSTIGGQIMSLTGMVDKRTLEKYEREAREKSRESWYLSWALDTNQEGIFIFTLNSNILNEFNRP